MLNLFSSNTFLISMFSCSHPFSMISLISLLSFFDSGYFIKSKALEQCAAAFPGCLAPKFIGRTANDPASDSTQKLNALQIKVIIKINFGIRPTSTLGFGKCISMVGKKASLTLGNCYLSPLNGKIPFMIQEVLNFWTKREPPVTYIGGSLKKTVPLNQ